MNFLVVDDSRVFREAVCLLIEEEGHDAEGVATPAAALERMGEAKFDAVLLDLHLGRESGLSLMPEILKLQPNQPVIVVSAQGTIRAAVQAMQQGAVDFLEKPFTRVQLHAVIARIRRFGELGRKIESLEEEVKESRAEQPDPIAVFETPAMKAVMELLARAAKSPASVLILGESRPLRNTRVRGCTHGSHFSPSGPGLPGRDRVPRKTESVPAAPTPPGRRLRRGNGPRPGATRRVPAWSRHTAPGRLPWCAWSA